MKKNGLGKCLVFRKECYWAMVDQVNLVDQLINALNWSTFLSCVVVMTVIFQIWRWLHSNNPFERWTARCIATAAVYGRHIQEFRTSWTSSECAALPAVNHWHDTGSDLQSHGRGTGTIQCRRLLCQSDHSWSGAADCTCSVTYIIRWTQSSRELNEQILNTSLNRHFCDTYHI